MSESRLKVAFIHQPWSAIEPPVNGADSVALLTDEIARQLSATCDVICYCRLGKHQPRVSDFESVQYRRASVSVDRWIKLFMQNLDRRGLRNPRRPFFSSTLCYRQFISEVLDDLANQNCDIVHIQNFSQFVPLIRRRFPNMKIVLQMHCEWLNQLDEKMIESRIQQADRVLCVSDFLAKKVRQRFPHLANRCGHLHNGASIARFAPPAGQTKKDKTILYVGRLSPEKGVHTLLDAFEIVLKKHPDARLELIGPEQVVPCEMIIPFCDDQKLLAMKSLYRPGVYGQLLREKIAKLPQGSVLFMSDGAEHTALIPHYRAATVFASPSIWEEPFGMPVVEAMAAGTAVIATRGGAFSEIVEHNRSGLLVPRGDAPSLADAILQMLSDEPARQAIAGAGQQRATSFFSWRRISETLLDEYNRLIAEEPLTQSIDETDPEPGISV